MIEILKDIKSGFSTQMAFEGWKVAFITFSDQYDQMKCVKRHTKTDEAFLLVEGSATLYTSDEQTPSEFIQTVLQPKTVYNVKRNTWHHLKVSQDALILVVENANTTKENTDCLEIKAK
jgi:hypothetical protein